ncbi:hypothetical protein GE115_16095 [Agromyces sp. CFH 90414]|uniref:DUF2207 domain-containing protein n=1 Tax=Agromyces agglutinans TaxID=2662258 RepID=A0A6I2F9Q7_9MICO|nr:DUF2207 domain-containing protein [Agromyces agglutinans]MRG61379.1 hypothetical protein [Agromyces agglutinans]
MTRRPRPDDGSASAAPDDAEPADTAPDVPAPDDAIVDDRPRHTPLWALLSGWLLGLEAWLRSHGGRGLRRGIRVFWAAVAAAGAFLLVGPVINPPMTLDDITSSASSATDDWIAREFAADYRIDRDDDGRLRAEVEERIDARFPDGVEATGIDRVLATEYQGHALDPSAISATLDGEPVEVAIRRDATQLTVTIDGGEPLSGDHEFEVRYRLQDLAYPTVDDATGDEVDLLEWDVFGPSWPQAFSGLDVTISIPDELDDRLIREPRGSLAWTLVGGGEWLEPEPDGPAGRVTYRMTNDQNIPPHAQAWFTMSFEAGTFAMPPVSPLFVVQSFGPLLPLALLVVALLFALAARAVAWADARGRPWFVARHDPPNVTPGIAAHVLGAPRAVELGEALDAIPQRSPRGGIDPAPRVRAARAARRTGRFGDLPRALTRYWFGADRRRIVADGLRRVPNGFVRDAFLAAPPALVFVQWGLVRQLSHQATLAVVWWPVAFVVASTVIAAIIMWIAWSSRPLTRRGALLKQHLRGIEAFAERTQLLDRGPSSDLALPYAVLGAEPGSAGRRVAAMLDAEIGDTTSRRGWRTPGYLTWPRLLVIGASLLLLPAMIAMIVLVPHPYERGIRSAAYDQELPGTLYTTVESAEIVGELTRSADGRAVVAVTERYEVAFDDSSGRVPQFAQQWRDRVEGQPLDLHLDAVRIDGDEVPFVTEQVRDTLLVHTMLREVLAGSHDVVVEYTLRSAAVGATGDEGGYGRGPTVDRVRWAALMEGWDLASSWRDLDTMEFAPTRVEFRVADDLYDLATESGWLTRDTDAADEVRDWPETVVPFGDVDEAVADPAQHGVEETTDDSGGELVAAVEFEDTEYGTPLALSVDDLGVRLDFPAGTFTGPDTEARRAWQAIAALPFAATLGLEVLAILVAGAGILAGLRRAPIAFRPGVFRDLLVWFAPAALLTAIVGFVWLTGDMVADHPVLPALGLPLVVALAAVVASLVLTRRKRAPV